jgi:cysteine sulfinate desulfinase/cysteine desulfurase-like protein
MRAAVNHSGVLLLLLCLQLRQQLLCFVHLADRFLDLARGALRVSLGRSNTRIQVDAFLDALQTCTTGLRGLAAVAV